MDAHINEGKLHKVDVILKIIMDRLAGIAIAPCAVALVIWVFIFVIYIVGRHFFGMVWLFVEEYTGYWVVFLAYISLAYALIKDAHIRSDIITSRLPGKAKNILGIVTDFLVIPLGGYLTYRSIGWLSYGIEYKTRAVSSLYTPLWPIYLFITIGLALFSFVLLLKLGRNLIKFAAGEDIEPQVLQ